MVPIRNHSEWSCLRKFLFLTIIYAIPFFNVAIIDISFASIAIHYEKGSLQAMLDTCFFPRITRENRYQQPALHVLLACEAA